MYNSSADLTQYMCTQHAINCVSAYDGASHSSTVELSATYTVKGHQHFPSQSHTDPGIYWDWSHYHHLLNGSSTGISSSSTAVRTSSINYNGSYSEQIKLVDNASSSSNSVVRFLSNGGSSSANTKLTINNGKVGFWVYSGDSGLTAAIGIDDNDGTERSDAQSIPANQWTFLEWSLDDASQWNPWYLGNGTLNASQVSIDAIWFFRAQTAYNVYVYIDDVQYRRN